MSNFTRRDFLKHAAAAAGAGAGPGLLGTAGLRRARAAEKPCPWKFSICNETFRDWPHEKAFAFASECGYQGVEIAPFTISNYVTDVGPSQRKKLRKLAEKNQLEVVGLHWLLAKTEGLHLTSPDKRVRKATADYLGALAEFCADLGGKVMIFGSPQQRDLQPGVTREQGMKFAAEVFQASVPALEKAGVKIGLEPLGPKTTNFIVFAADAVELARMIGSPQVEIILDCKAAITEDESIPELIRKYRRQMIHFHANDPNLRGPGMGDLDFVPIFQALRDIQFDDWVSVEVFDYTPGPERLARESITYMKKVVAQLDG